MTSNFQSSIFFIHGVYQPGGLREIENDSGKQGKLREFK